MPVYVVDTNVIIHGRGNLPDGTYFTTPAVQEEIENRDTQNTFAALDIHVTTPSADTQKTVNHRLDDENVALEDADRTLLALALDKDATLLTDDYALQNACQYFPVSYKPYMDTGITEHRDRVMICDTCGKQLSTDQNRCSCGGTPTAHYITTAGTDSAEQ